MKKNIITAVALTMFITTLFAQSKDSIANKKMQEISFDFCGFYTPILSQSVWGGNLDFKYFLSKKWSLGFSLSTAQKKVSDTFTYSIKEPIIAYYEIGIINQYDLIQTTKTRLGFNVNNGLIISRLGDNAIKEKYGRGYQAKEIATDNFYLLQFGFDFSYRILNGNHNPDLYLTSKAKYRFAFGNAQYANANDFNNVSIAFGLSLIGFSNNK